MQVWNATVQSWSPRYLSGGNIVVVPATVTVNGLAEPNVTINYSKGQVTFAGNLLATDIVEASHYSNKVGIYNTLERNRRPMIRLESMTSTDNNEDFSSFQELSVSETIAPPFILIETFPTGSASPVMVGSGAVWAARRVQLNVATETIGELSKILDILNVQSHRTIKLFNTSRAASEGLLPIDPLTGDINSSPNALQYPELIKQCCAGYVSWKAISVRKFKTVREDICVGIAYFTVEVESNPKL